MKNTYNSGIDNRQIVNRKSSACNHVVAGRSIKLWEMGGSNAV